jgi:hypothetical protein
MAKAFLVVIQTLVLSCILSELTQHLYEDHWCCKIRSDIKVPSKATDVPASMMRNKETEIFFWEKLQIPYIDFDSI